MKPQPMLAGKSRRELFRRYGSAFIWRYNAYKTLYEDIQAEIREEEYQRRQQEYWSAMPKLIPTDDTDEVFEQMGIEENTIRKSQVLRSGMEKTDILEGFARRHGLRDS